MFSDFLLSFMRGHTGAAIADPTKPDL